MLTRCEPQPSEWSVEGGMTGLLDEGRPSQFARLDRGWHMLNPDWIDATHPEIHIGPLQFASDASAGRVAADILREIYAHFGVKVEGIPYAQTGEVPEDVIKNAT